MNLLFNKSQTSTFSIFWDIFSPTQECRPLPLLSTWCSTNLNWVPTAWTTPCTNEEARFQTSLCFSTVEETGVSHRFTRLRQRNFRVSFRRRAARSGVSFPMLWSIKYRVYVMGRSSELCMLVDTLVPDGVGTWRDTHLWIRSCCCCCSTDDRCRKLLRRCRERLDHPLRKSIVNEMGWVRPLWILVVSV